ncbi:MAG: MarC family protein [Burkholderiales bacterium]|nr:MarC family protein [Burkholderiales bacterium]
MITEDIANFLTALLLVVGGLLPIVNPVGSAPMFLAMTRGADLATRQILALKIAINTFVLIMGSLVFGAFVLKVFGLSVPVVQVAGGAVLCALGWNLLNQEDTPPPSTAVAVDTHRVFMRAFYPLTLPLTVDPGAISVAITIGANHAHGVQRVIIGFLAGVTGTLIISLSVWFAYRYAQQVARWLGHERLMIVLRLSAFIVLCIGVQITWNGVRALTSELIATLPEHAVAADPAGASPGPNPPSGGRPGGAAAGAKGP